MEAGRMVIFAHMGGIDEIGIFVVPGGTGDHGSPLDRARARERAESEQEEAGKE